MNSSPYDFHGSYHYPFSGMTNEELLSTLEDMIHDCETAHVVPAPAAAPALPMSMEFEGFPTAVLPVVDGLPVVQVPAAADPNAALQDLVRHAGGGLWPAYNNNPPDDLIALPATFVPPVIASKKRHVYARVNAEVNGDEGTGQVKKCKLEAPPILTSTEQRFVLRYTAAEAKMFLSADQKSGVFLRNTQWTESSHLERIAAALPYQQHRKVVAKTKLIAAGKATPQVTVITTPPVGLTPVTADERRRWGGQSLYTSAEAFAAYKKVDMGAYPGPNKHNHKRKMKQFAVEGALLLLCDDLMATPTAASRAKVDEVVARCVANWPNKDLN